MIGVDIGKSVNSTVISAWSVEKSEKGNTARLAYIEEINPRSGGHDIPYQRHRIMEVATQMKADKLIIDATGIGGAIEQDLRVACISTSPQIHFIPFVFTGGPKGTKTQVYRDYVSFVQQGIIYIPNPKLQPPEYAKLINKWLREHIELEYVMDAANKTERIAAPEGKHDDYCDSSVIGIHAALTMLPGSGTFGSSKSKAPRRVTNQAGGNYSQGSLFTTRQRKPTLNKSAPLRL